LMKNKRGQTMCFVTLDDRTARIEAMLFSDSYDEYRDAIEKDQVVAISGVVSFDEYSSGLKFRASAVNDIASARSKFAKYLSLSLLDKQCEQAFIPQLKDALEVYRSPENAANQVEVEQVESLGACKVVLKYSRSEASVLIEFGQAWYVKPTDELLESLGELLGAEAVSLVY